MRKILFTITLATILFTGLSAAQQQVMAQGNEPLEVKAKQEDQTNLDTQLYLLVATNSAVDDAKPPVALDAVIKQLRATLPFKNYRVSATLINRVKSDGRLNLKWIGGPVIGSAASTTQTPSFNDFRVNNVKLVRDADGGYIVRMEGFGFGARIPIITGSTVASNGPAGPIINYENTGLNTDISMREGEPVIVGTLNVGPSGEAIILVMSAKRSGK
jgi:hypothetical protein